MGKKRVIKKSGQENTRGGRGASRVPKKKLTSGILYINAGYNNTMVSLTDQSGNLIISSSSGALGFSGSKKGTPYAASKIGELLAEKAETMGLKDLDIVIKGVGAGRESAVRSFINKGINVNSIKDATPVPFNGPKAKKPRRV